MANYTAAEASQDSNQILSTLLSNKDVKLEHFLKTLVHNELAECSSSAVAASSSSSTTTANKTFDELETEFVEKLGDKISNLSSVLWHRVGPVVQTLLNQKLKAALDAQLATVVHSQETSANLVDNYKTLFAEFTSSPLLSFQTGNPGALKNIRARDYWVLQYFALATCRRNRGDQCLQIGLSGKTSVGKSTLFEAPLTETVHQYLSDSGCGRFKLDSKPVLFFHDVDIHDICFGRDRDLIKTLARGEPTKSKIHSSTNTIPPVHLFYTSNTKLFNHKVIVESSPPPSTAPPPTLKREWQERVPETDIWQQQQPASKRKKNHQPSAAAMTTIPQNVSRQLQIPLLFGSMMMNSATQSTAAATANQQKPNRVVQKHLSEIVLNAKNSEHVGAVRARFLECYCPSKPQLSTHLFPTTGMFQRQHMICGIYGQVLDLVGSTYSSADFASLGLPLYVLSGLAKNAKLYSSIVYADDDEDKTASQRQDLFERLLAVAQAYFPPETHSQEYNSICNLLFNN